MATDEEVIRLRMEAAGFDDLNRQAQAAEKNLEDLQRELKAGVIPFDMFEAGVDATTSKMEFLRREMEKAKAAADRLKSIEATSRGMDSVAAAAGKAAGSSKNMGMAVLEGARALEDMQYGIAGVVNNVPGLVMALGGGMGVAAAVNIVAVGIAQLVKHGPELAKLFQEHVSFPKVAQDLAGMNKELSESQAKMAELGAKTSGTLAELAQLNTLRFRTAQLEKQIADEMERQNTAKKFKGLKDQRLTDEEKARVEVLEPNFGDPENEKLSRSVAASSDRTTKKAYEAAYKKALKDVAKNVDQDPFDLSGMHDVLVKRAEDLRQQVNDEEERVRKDAAQTAADAVSGGKEGAFNKIRDMMAAHPKNFTPEAIQAFENASPEGILKRKALEAKLNPPKEEGAAGGAGGGEAGGAGGGEAGGGGAGGGAGGGGNAGGGTARADVNELKLTGPGGAPPTPRPGMGNETTGMTRTRRQRFLRAQRIQAAKAAKAAKAEQRNAARARKPARAPTAGAATAGPAKPKFLRQPFKGRQPTFAEAADEAAFGGAGQGARMMAPPSMRPQVTQGQVDAQLISNQAALANQAGRQGMVNQQNLKAAQRVGQFLNAQQDTGLNYGGFP